MMKKLNRRAFSVAVGITGFILGMALNATLYEYPAWLNDVHHWQGGIAGMFGVLVAVWAGYLAVRSNQHQITHSETLHQLEQPHALTLLVLTSRAPSYLKGSL